jgi:hypothetical protein
MFAQMHRKSPLPRCVPPAFGGFWSIAPITSAVITSRSAAIGGRMMSGFLNLSPGSSAQLAASEVPMCGRISHGTGQQPSAGAFREFRLVPLRSASAARLT